MATTKLKAIQKSTLQERVYVSLRELIASGDLRPGEVITIGALAEQLGTSVMPVRESLFRLETDGAVIINSSSRKISVPVLSRDGVEELYAIRIELEGMATAVAAKKMTPSLLGKLKQKILAMDKAIKERNGHHYLLANRQFHFLIYRAAESEYLLPIIESLWLKFGPLLRIPIRPDCPEELEVMRCGQRHHKEAYEALSQGKPRQARAAIRGDLQNTRAWFKQNYSPDAYLKNQGS